MNPKISIVIPVYNVAPYLRECLDSILAQTFVDWEAICVDDGSTDGSGEILDEYAMKDSRFRVIHQKNCGVSMARQVGWDNSSGTYLAAVDPDDWIDEDYFENLVRVAVGCDADLVWCGFTEEMGNGNRRISSQSFSSDWKNQSLGLLRGDLFGGLCMRLVKRAFVLLNGVKFPPARILACEDLCVVLKILANNPISAYASCVGYHYRRPQKHSGGFNAVESYISAMRVSDYLDAILPHRWARNELINRRKSILANFYAEAAITDKILKRHSGNIKDLWGVNVPIWHKVFFWLAIRGLRSPIVTLLSWYRKSLGGRDVRP